MNVTGRAGAGREDGAALSTNGNAGPEALVGASCVPSTSAKPRMLFGIHAGAGSGICEDAVGSNGSAGSSGLAGAPIAVPSTLVKAFIAAESAGSSGAFVPTGTGRAGFDSGADSGITGRVATPRYVGSFPAR